MSKKKTEKESLDERVATFYKKQKALLDSLGLAKRAIINFKEGRKPSFITRFVVWYVGQKGGFLDDQFFNLRK